MFPLCTLCKPFVTFVVYILNIGQEFQIMNDFASRLKDEIQKGLPGTDVQWQMPSTPRVTCIDQKGRTFSFGMIFL